MIWGVITQGVARGQVLAALQAFRLAAIRPIRVSIVFVFLVPFRGKEAFVRLVVATPHPGPRFLISP